MIRIKLREFLERIGESQYKCSERTGINKLFIHKICNNDINDFPLKHLSRLCEVYGLEVDDILEYEK